MPKTLKQVAIDMANAFTRWQLWQGGGSTTLSDLTDVELTDLQADDVLQYDGNKWINAIVQGGGSVGGKVEYITQIGVLPIPIQYSNYDIIFFVVPSSDNVQLLGTLNCPSSDLPKQIQIPITNNSRVVITNTNMISERPAYCGNVLVYGIKFAPIEPNLHEYSTDEKVVGKWIDGKPIYEKVINSGYLPNASTISINVLNLNIDTIIQLKGMTFTDDKLNHRPITLGTSDSNSIRIDFTNNNIRIITWGSWNNYNSFIIIQYTKTTD